MAGYIIVFIYLGIMSVYDIKKREIHLPFTAVAALMLSSRQIYLVCRGEVLLQSAFLGVVIGIVLVAISLLTRGEIGVGDGILFMICGLLFGLYENLVLLFLSLVFTAMVSGALILTRRAGRKDTLPFAPFVFAGFGVMCIWKIFS